MKTNIRIKYISLSLVVSVLISPAAMAESSFDGKWVGTETCVPTTKINDNQKGLVPKPHKAMIVIARAGGDVGRYNGPCVGSYSNIRLSGNALVFTVADCKFSVTVSSDGKTLIEEGSCKMPTTWMMSLNGGQWPVTWLPLRITGTFHRVK